VEINIAFYFLISHPILYEDGYNIRMHLLARMKELRVQCVPNALKLWI